MEEEKRHFTRINFDARIIIKHDGVTIDGELVDISLKGALAKSPVENQLNVNDKCEVTIDLGCEYAPIQYDASVKHTDNELIGLCCDMIEPESASEIRRIVELNLGDTNLLHRELEAMMKVFN